MTGPEELRDIMIEIECIDRDVMERAGICPDTAARMMRDPLNTFIRMTVGERKVFWPVVKAAMMRNRPEYERLEREQIEIAQIETGELSPYIDPTDGSHP